MDECQSLVSIIMPAYNAAAFISESIESVIAQTYHNWELIVVDDGATDVTPDIVKEKAGRDCRIIYMRQENGRQARARNFGLTRARGELIAFLDADDLWLKNKLEIMVKEFAAGNQDLLFSGSYVFEDTFCIADISQSSARLKVIKGEYSGYSGLSDFLEMNKIPMLSVVVKAEVIKFYRFNELFTPAEDYDLWLRMLIDGYTFRSIEQPLVAYRLHPESSSSVDRLVSDTVIKIIYSLKAYAHDDHTTRLLDFYLKEWLRRKLWSIKDIRQLKAFVAVLNDMKLAKNVPLLNVLFALCDLVFKIIRRLLVKML